MVSIGAACLRSEGRSTVPVLYWVTDSSAGDIFDLGTGDLPYFRSVGLLEDVTDDSKRMGLKPTHVDPGMEPLLGRCARIHLCQFEALDLAVTEPPHSEFCDALIATRAAGLRAGSKHKELAKLFLA